MAKQYKAVFFDLYGTLIDIRTDEDSPRAWNALYEALRDAGAEYASADGVKRAFDEGLAQVMEGHESDRCYEPNYVSVYQRMLSDRGVSADERMARDMGRVFRRASTNLIRLYPGVMAMLDRLHDAGMRTVLVSNAQSCFTRPELALLGLDKALDDVLISSEEGVRKPAAEFFERALQREGIAADQVVMVGNDATSDIGGAANAGIDGIYFNTEISPSDDALTCERAALSCRGADYDAMLEFVLGRR